MKLEYGKRYVLRNGRVTEPLRESSLDDYPYTADVDMYHTCSWTKSGRQGYPTSQDSTADIVSEYVEPVCEEPAPKTVNVDTPDSWKSNPCVHDIPRKLQWVPGRTYKMRNGGLVFVILVDEGQSYPVTGFRLYPGEDAEQFPNTWTLDGKRHMGNVTSSFDIVDYAYEVGEIDVNT